MTISTHNPTDPTANDAPIANSVGRSVTDPNPQDAAANGSTDGAPATTAGIATKYWDQLINPPAGGTERLWLWVDDAWRGLANPAAPTRDAVQRAFIGAGQTVRVWYDGTVVKGLVVNN